MAVRQQFLDVMRRQERELDALFNEMLSRIAAQLARFSDREGKISLVDQRELRAAITSILNATILNVTQGNFTPWRISGGGTVEPQSPYFRLLWANMTEAMRLAVKEQADLMEARMLEFAASRLRTAFIDPFQNIRSLPAAEAAVLRRYEHPLVVRRADGRKLEERLIAATAETQRKTTRLIDQWVFEGRTALEMNEMLRRYYAGRMPQPGSARGGMELRRIARSEPIFAFSEAAVAAAATNPFITVVYVERTRQVPCPTCDPIAAKSPYSLEEVPMPGYHAHCVCRLRFITTSAARWDVNDPQYRQALSALSPRFIDLLLQLQRSRGE